MLNFMKYSSRFLQLLIISSLVVFTNACSGGSSSNGGGDTGDEITVTPQSQNLGSGANCQIDSSRCEARRENSI